MNDLFLIGFMGGVFVTSIIGMIFIWKLVKQMSPQLLNDNEIIEDRYPIFNDIEALALENFNEEIKSKSAANKISCFEALRQMILAAGYDYQNPEEVRKFLWSKGLSNEAQNVLMIEFFSHCGEKQ